MFDIELVIPVSSKPMFKKRIEVFKKWGVLNPQDKKTLVTLLIGTETIEDIENGWPDEIKIRVVPGEKDQCAAKVYEYFSNIDKVEARWIAKFDDDSVNDIAELVDHLDEEFDHERDYYIVTELRREMHKQENDILLDMGYHRWFKPGNIIYHELEGSVVSAATLNKIIKNTQAKQFLKRRSQIESGYTDYALAIAARLCKVYPSEAYFMEHRPLVAKFTKFGGHLAHIHGITEEKNPNAWVMFQKMLEGQVGHKKSKIYKDVVGKDFLLTEYGKMIILNLKANGVITGGGPEKAAWSIDGEKLCFLRTDGSVYMKFTKNENNIFEGKAHLLGDWVHASLRELI